jgi:hypothetical protein
MRTVVWVGVAVFGLAGCSVSRSESTLRDLVVPELARVDLGTPKTYPVKRSTVKEYHLELKGVDVRVRDIQSVTPEVAKDMGEQKLFAVNSLFQEQKSPYGGYVSKIVKCPSRFLPKISRQNGLHRSWLRIQTPSNGRRSLGPCNDDEFRLNYVWLMLYCPDQRRVLQVESYWPRDKAPDWNTWVTQADCGGGSPGAVSARPAAMADFGHSKY